jgi:hypothetical protein
MNDTVEQRSEGPAAEPAVEARDQLLVQVAALPSLPGV